MGDKPKYRMLIYRDAPAYGVHFLGIDTQKSVCKTLLVCAVWVTTMDRINAGPTDLAKMYITGNACCQGSCPPLIEWLNLISICHSVK